MLLETISNTQDMNYKTPIEVELGIDDKGMTTARKLYQFQNLRHRITQGGLSQTLLTMNLPQKMKIIFTLHQ